MPRVPDASSVTRLRSIQTSTVADPVKKSASYTPGNSNLLGSIRTSDVGKGVFPRQSFLSSKETRGYVNPRHKGVITGPSSSSSSSTNAVFILKTIPDTNNPGAGFFGFQIDPAVFVFSKTNANGQDVSAFMSGLSTATSFTLTNQTQFGIFIYDIPTTPTDAGTHWLVPYPLEGPGGPGGAADIGDRLVVTYA